MKKILRMMILLFAIGAVANATTYYVATTGTDSNNGSSAGAAFATIQRCAAVMVAGDTCDVLSGTYNLTSQLGTGRSGTSGNPITFKSDTKWGAHIVAQPGISTNVWYNTGDYVNVDGFDITVVPTNTVGVILKTDGNYNRFTNNRLHDNIWTTCGSGGAIETTYNINLTPHNTQNEYIGNNVIYNIGADISVSCDQLHGMYIGSDYSTIVNNLVIHAQSGLAIQIYGDTPMHNVIANNTVVNSNYGIGIGSNVSSVADYNYVSNNISYNNKVYGIYEVGGVQGGHEVFTNNLAYGNLQGNFVVGTPNLSAVIAAPQFVNYTGDGTGNYHLQSTSPAVDMGTSTNAPSTDLDGVTRPQGASYDIGTYEFVTSVPTPPTALAAIVH